MGREEKGRDGRGVQKESGSLGRADVGVTGHTLGRGMGTRDLKESRPPRFCSSSGSLSSKHIECVMMLLLVEQPSLPPRGCPEGAAQLLTAVCGGRMQDTQRKPKHVRFRLKARRNFLILRKLSGMLRGVVQAPSVDFQDLTGLTSGLTLL